MIPLPHGLGQLPGERVVLDVAPGSGWWYGLNHYASLIGTTQGRPAHGSERSRANLGHYKSLFACVDRTFGNQFHREIASDGRQETTCILDGPQMLALGRGLMALPRLLMVDEPFLGLAPRVVEQMKSVFQALQA